MAYYQKNADYSRKSKGSKYCELERMAFNLGKISRGIQNSNSKVYESYNNGLSGKSSKNTKPLI